MSTHTGIFNPKILDASIRDVSSCLSDNQKADLLLYAMNSLAYEGRSKIVFENAIQSCLQVSTLSPENTAKARILRARARLNSGSLFGAQEDLHAALEAEPDNPEAKALLHQRSVNVEKLLAPVLPTTRGRFSNEIWREIASFLSRKDLKTLLFVPNPLSKIASQLLFKRLDLHFTRYSDVHNTSDLEDDSWRLGPNARDRSRDSERERDTDSRHAQRTADILTRIITDTSFASVVRTLRIFTFTSENGSMPFQTGILSNALPKLINLQHVHITSPVEGVLPLLHILQTSHPRLRGLSLEIKDGAVDLSSLTFKHLAHFCYETNGSSSSASGGNSPSLSSNIAPSIPVFLIQNRTTLRTLAIEDPTVTFPTTSSIAIRNLTHLSFLGQIPLTSSQLVPDLLQHGRQLECLNLTVLLDCPLSPYFRSIANSLPFLRHFSFNIAGSASRRLNDRDLFPSIADFLRDRRGLRTLGLTVGSSNGGDSTLRATGFDSSLWGVLPSLAGLKGLMITYPKDLAPALGMWLIPRTVVTLVIDGLGSQGTRDPVGLLNQLRPGVPPSLLFVSLSDFPLRSASQIVEHGFPMVRLIRVGGTYWTVLNNVEGYVPGFGLGGTGITNTGRPSPRPHSSGSTYSSSSHKSGSPSIPSTYLTSYTSGPGVAPVPIAPAGPLPPNVLLPTMSGSGSGSASGTASVSGRSGLELEQWPKRRAAFHLREWLEWLGCENGEAPNHQEFLF